MTTSQKNSADATGAKAAFEHALSVLSGWTGYSDRLRKQDSTLLERLAEGPRTREQLAEAGAIPDWSYRRLSTGCHGPKGKRQSDPLIRRVGKGEAATWEIIPQG